MNPGEPHVPLNLRFVVQRDFVFGDDLSGLDLVFLGFAPESGRIGGRGLAFQDGVRCDERFALLRIFGRPHVLLNLRHDDGAVDVGPHPVAFAVNKRVADALNLHAGAFLKFLGDDVFQDGAEVHGIRGRLWFAFAAFVLPQFDRRAPRGKPQGCSHVRAADTLGALLQPLFAGESGDGDESCHFCFLYAAS